VNRLHLLILSIIEQLYPLADRLAQELERGRDRAGADYVRRDLGQVMPHVIAPNAAESDLLKGAAVCRRWADALIREFEETGRTDDAHATDAAIRKADHLLTTSIGRIA
jgi:hypothetical protein